MVSPSVEIWNGSSWDDIPFRNWNIENKMFEFGWLDIVTSLDQLLNNYGVGAEVRLFDSSGTLRFGGRLVTSGRETNQGNVNFRAKQYGYLVMQDRLTISSVSTNIDVIQEFVNEMTYRDGAGNLQSFTLNANDTPVDVNDYSFDGQARRVVTEMTEKLNWVFHNDGEGQAYYEQYGSRSSGENITIGSDKFKVNSFEPNVTEDVVSEVRVTGRNVNGNQVVETASAGSADISRFQDVRIDFPISSSEAQTIANEKLNPDGSTELVLEGEDKFDYIVNEKIDVTDNDRLGGTTTFTVQRQEVGSTGRVKLRLNTERRLNYADRDSYERDEFFSDRKKVPSNIDQDFGNQDINDNTDQGSANNDTDEQDKDVPVSGDTDDSNVDVDYTYGQDGGFGDLSEFQSAQFISGNADYTIISVTLSVNREGSQTSDAGYDLEVTNDSTNTTIFSENGVCDNEETFSVTLIDSDGVEGDDYIADAFQQHSQGWFANISLVVQTIGDHTHNIDGTSVQTNLHRHDVDVTDQGHDHVINASTAQKILSLLDIEDVDR